MESTQLQPRRKKVSLLVIVLFSNMGMLLFGFHTTIFNASMDGLKSWVKPISEDESDGYVAFYTSVCVSLLGVGGAFGALIAPYLVKVLGPRRGIEFNMMLQLLSSILMIMAFACNFTVLLLIGRFFMGLTCALAMAVVPIFIAQVTPYNKRGLMGTSVQFAVTLGLLAGLVIGQPILLGVSNRLVWLSSVSLIPLIIQAMTISCVPVEDQDDDPIDPDCPVYTNHWSYIRSYEWIKRPLLVGVLLHASQQLTGINICFYYSTSVFQKAGFSVFVSSNVSILIGVIMVLMTLITMFLMDSLGRRVLHLGGLSGMLISSIVLTYTLKSDNYDVLHNYLRIAALLSIVVFFAIGPGSVPFLVMSEIFPRNPRDWDVSICVIVNWLCNALIGVFFPFLQLKLGSNVFFPFIALQIFFIITLHLYLPETKKVELVDVVNLFEIRRQPHVQEEIEPLPRRTPSGRLVESRFNDRKLPVSPSEGKNFKVFPYLQTPAPTNDFIYELARQHREARQIARAERDRLSGREPFTEEEVNVSPISTKSLPQTAEELAPKPPKPKPQNHQPQMDPNHPLMRPYRNGDKSFFDSQGPDIYAELSPVQPSTSNINSVITSGIITTASSNRKPSVDDQTLTNASSSSPSESLISVIEKRPGSRSSDSSYLRGESERESDLSTKL